MLIRAALLASVGLTVLIAPAGAQILTVDHPGQYTQEDIGRGSLLYNAQCFACHGRDGDQISGVDLRRGLFRRAQSDEDLAQTITRGTPGGMPPFKLDPAELTGIVAYIRAGFDASASVRVGSSTRGRALFEGKGECATLPPRRRQGSAFGAGPERHRHCPGPGRARTLGPRSLVGAAANQPARAHRDARREDDSRPPAERGYAHGADHRRTRALVVYSRRRTSKSLDVVKESAMPSYAGKLTDEEIADVVAYLLTLRQAVARGLQPARTQANGDCGG